MIKPSLFVGARAKIGALLLLCLTPILPACTGDKGRNTVLLIDRSGSIKPEDRAIYEPSILAIANGLSAGDRLLVAPIGEGGRSAFLPIFRHEVAVSDVRMRQEREIARARKAVAAAMDIMLQKDAARTAQSTRILETIAEAAKSFGSAADDGDRLIILSDGVEEGPLVNLAKSGASPESIAAAIKRADQAGLLPNLAGVEFHLIGAGGDGTAAGHSGVELFWRNYAERTGAKIGQIGRLPWAG